MKRLLILFFVAMLPCVAMAQVQVMVNRQPAVNFDATGGIYFHNDTVTIIGTTQTLQKPLEEVFLMQFNSLYQSVRMVDESELTVYPTLARNYVYLRGVGSQPQEVLVYNMQGMVVLRQCVADDGAIALGTLAAGEYLLRCCSKTVKFIKM